MTSTQLTEAESHLGSRAPVVSGLEWGQVGGPRICLNNLHLDAGGSRRRAWAWEADTDGSLA